MNYEYTLGESEASVKAGSPGYFSQPGSPDATGDITILSNFTVDGNKYSVTSIGNNAFYYCGSLTLVTIPEGVTSIGAMAFCNCSSLTSVTIPNSLTNIGDDAFNYVFRQ